MDQPLSESSIELSAQLGHLLNKATYGRESRGHYALALPHYLHFTSPLRRWADFLVHRCLKAYLKGESTPYSSAEIDQFAEEINEFQRLQKDSRDRYLKEKANKKLIKTVRDVGYSSLSRAEFSRLIKLAIRENQLQDVNNFCQQESLAKPKYNHYQKNGFFICEASLRYKGQVYQEQGVALKKRKAQIIAVDKIIIISSNQNPSTRRNHQY